MAGYHRSYSADLQSLQRVELARSRRKSGTPRPVQQSRSAYVRNLAYRFRSFMAMDRKVSAHRGTSK